MSLSERFADRYKCVCGFSCRTALVMRNHTSRCIDGRMLLKDNGLSSFRIKKGVVIHGW